jgi:hypothetical protein
VHQASTVAAVREEGGRMLARGIFATDEEAILEFFGGIRAGHTGPEDLGDHASTLEERGALRSNEADAAGALAPGTYRGRRRGSGHPRAEAP